MHVFFSKRESGTNNLSEHARHRMACLISIALTASPHRTRQRPTDVLVVAVLNKSPFAPQCTTVTLGTLSELLRTSLADPACASAILVPCLVVIESTFEVCASERLP